MDANTRAVMLGAPKPRQELSPIGKAALKAREGDRLVAYRDSVGIWTIGVGVTTASGLIIVTPGLRITQAQSDALFDKASEKYVQPVRAALAKPVPQHFFDACVSLCYNIGPAGFARSSVVRHANAGHLDKAIEAFLMWNKPSEIIGRRQAERDQAATPYAVRLPKARRGDARPIPMPKGAFPGALASEPESPPAPAMPPIAAPAAVTARPPAARIPATADRQPAPTGVLSPFWAWLRSLVARPSA